MATGIYTITNVVNGKRYVGSACRFVGRWSKHRKALREGIHHSLKLQRAWDKYGEENFVFEKLLICAKPLLIFYEQRALDVLQPGYNIAKVAGSCLGLTHSMEARAKMSAACVGREYTAVTRAKMSAAKRGTTLTRETKAKISASQKGRGCSPETREKIAASLRGQKHTDERRAKQSAAKIGLKPTPEAIAARVAGVAAMSPEAKKAWGLKVSATNAKVMGSPEKREAMSKKLKGRAKSDEHKAKLKAYALNRTPEHLAKLSAAATAQTTVKGKQNA